jgi:hypothetical protein
MPSGEGCRSRRCTQMDADARGAAEIGKRAKEPMPSGGRVHHRGHRGRGNTRCARQGRKGFSVASVSSVVDLSGGPAGRSCGFWTMDPMPSGGAGEAGAEGAAAAQVGAGLAQEGAHRGRAGAVGQAGAAGAGEALGRARAGAETAMQAAAAVGHSGLATRAAAAGAGAAARGGQEIAGPVAVLQVTAAAGREGGWGSRSRNWAMELMPSGDRLTRSRRAPSGSAGERGQNFEHDGASKVLPLFSRNICSTYARSGQAQRLPEGAAAG